MQKDPDKDLISINQLLGEQPTILFIPANQLIPWSNATKIRSDLALIKKLENSDISRFERP